MSLMTKPRRPRPAAATVLAVVLSLALGGCSLDLFADEDPAETAPSPTLSPSPVEPADGAQEPSADLTRYYQQEVSWEGCREGKLCGKVEVPLDYSDPDGPSISLSLLKVPAGSKRQRVGSLLVNPGGPGGSGVEYAAQASLYFGSELQQAFDIVGFDPRGVGESTPVQCLSDDELDELVASDPDPDTPAELAEADRMLAEFGQGCVDKSGDLASHVSTVEVARDMDVIRAVLGDRRLTYFGASYGTRIGATYAELFPRRVGRMVLDGAIDPTVGIRRASLVQARGFETALRSYVAGCVYDGDCFLGDSVPAGTKRVRQLLDEVEERPLKGSGGRELAVGNAVLGIWAPLYNRDYWPMLDTALQAALDGDGGPLLALSDAYTSRGPDGYRNNSLEALYAVNCLDQRYSVPAAEVPSQVPRFEKASPTFGAIFAFGLASCASWPVEAALDVGRIDAKGADPILVIGTTRDPATPMRWAEALASQLDSGVLVRRDGDGHTGYNAGNRCVDDTVESYLVSGVVPKSDVDC